MERLNWDDYRFVLAVSRTGTISTAAKMLEVDHATVIRRVERLERSVGERLFDRSSTGYQLTAAGERIATTAARVEAAVLAGLPSDERSDLLLTGVVRIGAPDGFGTYFLAPRMATLLDHHPNLEIQLVASARLFNMSRRETDIAITLSMPNEGRLVGRKLTDYKLGLYCSYGYLKANGPINHRNDLRNQRFCGYIDDLLFSKELDYLHQIDKDIKPQFASANLIAQLMATLRGFGLAVLPCFMAHSHPDLVAVMPSEISISRTFWLLMHEDGRDINKIRIVTDMIYNVVERNRSLFNPY